MEFGKKKTHREKITIIKVSPNLLSLDNNNKYKQNCVIVKMSYLMTESAQINDI